MVGKRLNGLGPLLTQQPEHLTTGGVGERREELVLAGRGSVDGYTDTGSGSDSGSGRRSGPGLGPG
ncbi:hypothetical protein OG410_23215 [Streptomyces sp. NBC_00659]|uniref:hypothetical protein n=1 Tax=Streptomyces sp. NBC_00659 TaxID=2903669 RepID=UPI002E344C76|nr:hypothetical protein [Streptomyces sp. NBC_00659]